MTSLLKLTKYVISSLCLLSNVFDLVINFEVIKAVDVVNRLSAQLITLLSRARMNAINVIGLVLLDHVRLDQTNYLSVCQRLRVVLSVEWLVSLHFV